MCALKHNLISSVGVFFGGNRAISSSRVRISMIDFTEHLSTRVSERRTSIRSEAYSILICLYATKFVALSVFPLEETICPGEISAQEFKMSTSGWHVSLKNSSHVTRLFPKLRDTTLKTPDIERAWNKEWVAILGLKLPAVQFYGSLKNGKNATCIAGWSSAFSHNRYRFPEILTPTKPGSYVPTTSKLVFELTHVHTWS